MPLCADFTTVETGKEPTYDGRKMAKKVVAVGEVHVAASTSTDMRS